MVQLPGAGPPAQALGHGVVVDGGGKHQPRHLPPHTVLAVQTLDPDAVMAIEAGAQLVEAAHNPDNLAACDRPRVRVTLVLDDWPREAIDHLPPAVRGQHSASVSVHHLRAVGLTSG